MDIGSIGPSAAAVHLSLWERWTSLVAAGEPNFITPWIDRSDARGRLRVEQHRLVEVEGEGMVLAAPDIGVGAHPRRQLLARGVDHDKGVRAGGLDDLHGRIEFDDGFRVAVDALAVVHGLRANPEDDLGAVVELAGIDACGDWQ